MINLNLQETLAEHGIALPVEQDPEIQSSELSMFSEWPLVCKVLWYPYEEQYCRQARCVTCSPAILAASHVCRQNEGRVTERCLRSTIGRGHCNTCVPDFLN